MCLLSRLAGTHCALFLCYFQAKPNSQTSVWVMEMVLEGKRRARKVKSEWYITELKYPWVFLFLPPFHLTFIFIRTMALNSD